MFVLARSQNHLKVARKSKILVALPKKIRSSSIGYNHMSHDARKSDCDACINKDADQPARMRRLVSALVIRSLQEMISKQACLVESFNILASLCS